MHNSRANGKSIPQTRTVGPGSIVEPSPSAEATNVRWAGIRSSAYGIRPFPSLAGWSSVLSSMASYFPGAAPIGVWLVGEIFFDGANSGIDLEFPNPGGTYDSRIRFGKTDKHEAYLSYFDALGINVFLQVESGYASMPDLINSVLKHYGHHPSVVGFGVDVEWYQSEGNGCKNTPVTDSLAQAWEALIKAHNPDYRLFLKHFERINLPPSYRGDIIFINDHERLSDYDSFRAEKKEFADFFYPNDVIFQIGYPSDKGWWSKLEGPIPQIIGRDLAQQTRQNCGIVWVDFSLQDVFAGQLTKD